ncbi:EAL domain-containing protein, partial [Escherichia coli]|nr:EAL domain-containing protein [Escherichia coli]
SQLNAKQESALELSVNMSPVQLRTSALIERTQSALVRSGFPATSLEFEVTEGALIDDTEASRQVMEGLKALGVRLAVDYFGTGYAGLSY